LNTEVKKLQKLEDTPALERLDDGAVNFAFFERVEIHPKTLFEIWLNA